MHPTALEDELCLSADDRGADFEHPAERRQPEGNGHRAPQGRHERTVVRSLRRDDIHDTADVSTFHQESDAAIHIVEVYPAELLATPARTEVVIGAVLAALCRGEPAAVTLGATEAETNE